MRKFAFLAFFIMTVGLFFGCKPSKTDGNNGSGDSTNAASATAGAVEDSTMYGTYVDGGHGGFMLKCDDDSVREFVVDLDNDSDVVFGGMAAATRWPLPTAPTVSARKSLPRPSTLPPFKPHGQAWTRTSR